MHTIKRMPENERLVRNSDRVDVAYYRLEVPRRGAVMGWMGSMASTVAAAVGGSSYVEAPITYLTQFLAGWF